MWEFLKVGGLILMLAGSFLKLGGLILGVCIQVIPIILGGICFRAPDVGKPGPPVILQDEQRGVLFLGSLLGCSGDFVKS